MANDLELRIVVKDDGSIVVKKFGNEAEEALAKAKRASESLQAATDKLARAGGVALVGFAAGLTAIAVSSVSTATELESAFTGVEKTVEATASEFAVLRGELEDLTKTIPVTATEIFGVAEAAGQLGIATGDITDFTTVMAQLGVTTNLSATEAATSLARFRNIVGDTGNSFGQLGSSIVALGNNLATTEAEIVEFGLRLAGAGTVIGLSEDQILAMGGALSSLGIQAEAGGSAFQRLFIDLGNAVASGGEEVQKFADAARLSVGDFTTLFEEDAAGAIEALLQGLNDLDAEGGNVFATLDDLGLSGIRVQKAMLAASLGVDTFSDALDIAEEAIMDTSALTDEAALRFATFESQSMFLSNAVDLLQSKIGDALIPVLTKMIEVAIPIVEAFTSIAVAFGDLPLSVQGVIVVLAGMATALIGIVGTIGIFLPQIRNLISAFKLVRGAGAAASLAKIGISANVSAIGVRALSLAMSGLAIVGVAAVAVAIGTLINKFLIGEQRLADFAESLGFIEPALLATDASMQALSGSAEDTATKLEFLNSVNDRFKDSTGGVVTSIREGIAAGLSYDTIIASLTDQMQMGGEEGDLLRSIMSQVSTEMSAAASASDDAADGIDDVGNAAEKAAEKLKKAVDALGLVTVGAAVGEIAQLQLVIDEAGAPTDALVAKVLELTEKYGGLAGKSDEVQSALDGITGSVDQEILAIAKLDAAIESFGVQTVDQAITKIGQLNTIIAAGALPPALLAAEVLKLEEEFADLAAAQPEVQAALEATRVKLGEEAIAALETKAAIEALGLVSLGDLTEELDALVAAFEAGAGSPKQLEDALESLQKKAEDLGFDELADDIEALQMQMDAAAAAAGRLEDPFKKFEGVLSDLGVKTIPSVLARLKDIPAAMRAGTITASEAKRVVEELDEEYKELRDEAPRVAAALDEITEAAREQGAELEKDKGAVQKFTDKLKTGLSGLTDPENIQEFIGAGIGDILSGNFTEGLSQIVSEIGATIGAAFGPLGKIVGQLAGKLVGVIKNVFSKPEFKKVAKDVGRDLGVDISDELAKTIAEESKETGNRVGAIVKNLPAIIAEAGVANDAALQTFVARARVNLNELDRGTIDSAQAFGQLGESLTLLIPKIGEVGASGTTVTQVFEVLDAALGQVRSGLADTADGAKLLEETFPLLVEEMKDFGAEGVFALRGIIEQSRELGLEVEAITQFVVQQTGAIASGVGTIISSLTKRISQLPEDLNFGATFREAQKQFKNAGTMAGAALVDGVVTATTDPKLAAAVLGIGTQAQFAAGAIATVFAELLAQGVPVTDIVKQTAGSIKELGQVFVDLGIEAPASFKAISSFARKLAREDIAPVVEGIQGMGQALEGLSALGLATQSDFAAFGTSLAAGFDQLTMSGLSSKEAFAAIGPQIQDLVDLQEKFGFTVDAGTQALIDQAVQQGVVKTASLDTTDSIQAGFQGLFDRFDAFLGKQGVATDGFFQFGDQAAKAMSIVSESSMTAANDFEQSFSSASQSSSAAVDDFAMATSTSYSDIASEADATAQAQTESFSASFDTIEADAQALQVSSTAQFDILKQQAVESAATVSSTFSTGFQAIEGAVGDLGSVAANAFGGIEDAASDAVDGAIASFRDMQRQLVGESIIPDTVSEANRELLSIGDAARIAAENVTRHLGDGFEAGGDELQRKIDALRKRLQSGQFEGEEERGAADRRLDELIAQQRPGGDSRGGDDADRERRRRERDIGMDFPRRRGGGDDDTLGGRGGRGGMVFNITVNVSAEVLTDRKALESAGQQIANIVNKKFSDETRFRGIRRRQQ